MKLVPIRLSLAARLLVDGAGKLDGSLPVGTVWEGCDSEGYGICVCEQRQFSTNSTKLSTEIHWDGSENTCGKADVVVHVGCITAAQAAASTCAAAARINVRLPS